MTISRRPLLLGAVVATDTLAAAALPASAASATGGSRSEPKPTVVLVHGAFADASSWSAVASRLQKAGYTVVAPANPLRGLTTDAAYIFAILKTIDGPKVVVGHSYGGAVITQATAGDASVKALVYVAAFVPDKGEQLGELGARFPGSQLSDALQPLPDGAGGTDPAIQTATFHAVFTADGGLARHPPEGGRGGAGPGDLIRPGALRGQAGRFTHDRGELLARRDDLPPRPGHEGHQVGGDSDKLRPSAATAAVAPRPCGRGGCRRRDSRTRAARSGRHRIRSAPTRSVHNRVGSPGST